MLKAPFTGLWYPTRHSNFMKLLDHTKCVKDKCWFVTAMLLFYLTQRQLLQIYVILSIASFYLTFIQQHTAKLKLKQLLIATVRRETDMAGKTMFKEIELWPCKLNPSYINKTLAWVNWREVYWNLMGKLLSNTAEDIEKNLFLTPAHLCFHSALTQSEASQFEFKKKYIS